MPEVPATTDADSEEPALTGSDEGDCTSLAETVSADYCQTTCAHTPNSDACWEICECHGRKKTHDSPWLPGLGRESDAGPPSVLGDVDTATVQSEAAADAAKKDLRDAASTAAKNREEALAWTPPEKARRRTNVKP